MEEFKTNAGHGLGIAGLVLGLIAILICFFPCFGIFAIIPGLVGITLSSIAYNQAVKGNGARGFIIAALVVSILGSSVALMQGLFISSLSGLSEKFVNKIEHKIDVETDKAFDEHFEHAGKEMEQMLEQLENVGDSINHIEIKIDRKMSDKEFDKLMENYEKLIKQTTELAQKSKKGENQATVDYAKIAIKLAAVHAKMLSNLENLSADQRKKLEDINRKYEKELDDLKN
jgi:hypothetical protein